MPADNFLYMNPNKGDTVTLRTDNRLVDRNDHIVNTIPVPLASFWRPILLRYQPVDRARPSRKAALMRPTSAHIALD
jgi:hypothetical protein